MQRQKKIETIPGKFYFKELAFHYLRSQHKVHRIFRKILEGNEDLKKEYPYLLESYLHLATVPFAYATTDAYEKIRHRYPKEKETDVEIKATAHYDEHRGIFVSLNPNDNLQSTIAHEYGHYLHHTLTPDQYRESSPTMKEVMAIFIEGKCGYHTNYATDLPHYRAEQLLKKLENTKTYGKEMSISDKWNFLNDSDYETLEMMAKIME